MGARSSVLRQQEAGNNVVCSAVVFTSVLEQMAKESLKLHRGINTVTFLTTRKSAVSSAPKQRHTDVGDFVSTHLRAKCQPHSMGLSDMGICRLELVGMQVFSLRFSHLRLPH